MMNWALYKREMKKSVKLLVIFAAIMTLYISVIISMYDPKLMETLDSFVEVMPELMAAVGMSAGATTLVGFMISYLYGFILLIFPMVFSILRGNGLISKYVEKGSMISLVSAPVKRKTIALTQMIVLISGVAILILYATALEFGVAQSNFSGELDLFDLLKLNGGLLCLHLFIAGICFLASCIFSDTKYSLACGAGIPFFMYVLQMLANAGEKAEFIKYFSLFTLFDPYGIAANECSAWIGIAVLLIGAILLFGCSIYIFCEKDLHI